MLIQPEIADFQKVCGCVRCGCLQQWKGGHGASFLVVYSVLYFAQSAETLTPGFVGTVSAFSYVAINSIRHPGDHWRIFQSQTLNVRFSAVSMGTFTTRSSFESAGQKLPRRKSIKIRNLQNFIKSRIFKYFQIIFIIILIQIL